MMITIKMMVLMNMAMPIVLSLIRWDFPHTKWISNYSDRMRASKRTWNTCTRSHFNFRFENNCGEIMVTATPIQWPKVKRFALKSITHHPNWILMPTRWSMRTANGLVWAQIRRCFVHWGKVEWSMENTISRFESFSNCCLSIGNYNRIMPTFQFTRWPNAVARAFIIDMVSVSVSKMKHPSIVRTISHHFGLCGVYTMLYVCII